MQSKTTRAFRTISEAGEELGLQPHVLRFWESKFPQIKPMKRGGGRRFYRPEDIEFLRGIKILLHDEKHPIKDVQKLIRMKGASRVLELGRSMERAAKPKPIEETVLIPERIVKSKPSSILKSVDIEPPVEAHVVTPELPPISVVPPKPDVVEVKADILNLTPDAALTVPQIAAIPGENYTGLEGVQATEKAVTQPGLSDGEKQGLSDALSRLEALKSRWDNFKSETSAG